MNVVGYVGRAPAAFDVIIDPFFLSPTPLMAMEFINGKTPSNILIAGKFMNCSGKIRMKDGRKIQIDTPSTYGFSGGLCFVRTGIDPWQFYGIMSEASRLWNICISLKESRTFLDYINNSLKTKRENSDM